MGTSFIAVCNSFTPVKSPSLKSTNVVIPLFSMDIAAFFIDCFNCSASVFSNIVFFTLWFGLTLASRSAFDDMSFPMASPT